MKILKKDIWFFLAQLAVWLVVLLLVPIATLLATKSFLDARTIAMMLSFSLMSPFVLYFLNYYVFWKWLWAKRRYVLFFLANILAFLIIHWRAIYMFFAPPPPHHHHHGGEFQMPTVAWLGYASNFFIYFLLNVIAITAAIAIRHFIQMRKIRKQLEEEKHKTTEAELAWLKNQINPHFLFNTLNNISSLTQIDPDAAQDAIAQLSDLLRYAIYKTDAHTVPVGGEVEFMRDYIALMQLRCNEKTAVTTRFDIDNPQAQLPPLLFISFIENAFKHGVSSNRKSTIDIYLTQDKDSIVFECDNTNYPKSDKDRSGSGVGLENSRRRLNLLYDKKYTWEQSVENDIYHIKITIPT